MALPFETVLKQITVHFTRDQLYRVIEEATATLKAQDTLITKTEEIKEIVKKTKAKKTKKEVAEVVEIAEETAPPAEPKKNAWHLEVEAVLAELRLAIPEAKYKDAMIEASKRRKEKTTADDETLTMTTSSSLCDRTLTPEEERYQFLLQTATSKSTLTSLTNSLKYRFALPVEEAKAVVAYFLAHQDEIRSNLA